MVEQRAFKELETKQTWVIVSSVHKYRYEQVY